jgi:DNA (cytosine-5)-methyltransferase 1
MTLGYYEFFAGGGMTEPGLDPLDLPVRKRHRPKKALSYATNWGEQQVVVKDVAHLKLSELPGIADLVWASFPCQDLSLAGMGAGLDGDRSGTFWPVWNLMKALRVEKRAPRMIVLENVKGALTSHGRRDFAAIGAALTNADYRFGAMLIDAVHFLPQSRPRLFVVRSTSPRRSPTSLRLRSSRSGIRPRSSAYGKLSSQSQRPGFGGGFRAATRNSTFADILEDDPQGFVGTRKPRPIGCSG